MKERSNLHDRRIAQRFPVKTGALAFNAKICGQIIDISLEGLSFHYIEQNRETPQRVIDSGKPRSGAKTLDIIFGDYNFTLNDMPIKIISDYEVNAPHPYRSTATKRRRCVQFEKLNPEQRFWLKRFILINRYGLVPVGARRTEFFQFHGKANRNVAAHTNR